MRVLKAKDTQSGGMRTFLVVWIGQVVSLFGTSLTQFALTIWAWQLTGEATALALVGLFSYGPTVILSPIAGALVDRWNRKLVMMLSDLAAGMSTIAVAILYVSGNLEIWHLYVAGFFTGAFQSFQFPAYSAAVTMMLPKEQYARASAMLAMADSAARIFAPAIAATLLVFIGIGGILFIDIVTFLFALGTLAWAYIPQPKKSADEEVNKAEGNLLQETLFGFKYIIARRGLLGVQMIFFLLNLFSTMGFTLLAPMILARMESGGVSTAFLPTPRDGENIGEIALGVVQSAMAIGGLLGGIALSIWGGPKRRIHGVLFGMMASSLIGTVLFGLARTPLVWIITGLVGSLFIALLNASNQALWQSKVDPNVQGRVFAVRMWIAQITIPLAMLIAGPLADRVFEPAMMPDGALAGTFGGLMGTGAGAGMALIFVITGILSMASAVIGYLIPAIRNVEDLIPDHEAVADETVTPIDEIFDDDILLEGVSPVGD